MLGAEPQIVSEWLLPQCEGRRPGSSLNTNGLRQAQEATQCAGLSAPQLSHPLELECGLGCASFLELPWSCVSPRPCGPRPRRGTGLLSGASLGLKRLRLLGGLWLQRVVLSRRCVAHAAADGGRWAGLCGRGDGSRIPLLLSSLVRGAVVFEK